MQGIRTVERWFLAGSRRVAVGGNGGGPLISDTVTRVHYKRLFCSRSTLPTAGIGGWEAGRQDMLLNSERI
jgi:hypothetical protein